MVETFQIISLTLTPVVYFVCLVVLAHFGFSVLKNPIPTSANHWLILGIFISFAGKLLDNGYWNGAWVSYQYGVSELWFTNGPIANTWFRQIPLITAGSCHIIAASKASGKLNTVLLSTCIISALGIFTIMFYLGRYPI